MSKDLISLEKFIQLNLLFATFSNILDTTKEYLGKGQCQIFFLSTTFQSTEKLES